MNDKKIEFGTGGFRGVIGDDFSRDNIQLVGKAIANIVKFEKSEKPIVVGYDYRFMSDYAAKWIAEVLAYNGIKVLISKEPTPTPAVMFKTKKESYDFGIMITASHNPYYFNGIKVFQKEGMDADINLTSRIEQQIALLKNVEIIDFDEALSKGFIEYISFIDEYVENIKSFMDQQIQGSDINILIDDLHGVGVTSLSPLIEKMSFKNIKIVNYNHDAFFENMLPNPTKNNMEKDRKYLNDYHYDCIAGLDSDADRLGMLDELGNYVDSNEILASLYYYFIKYRHMSGDIVKNLATSNLLDKVAQKCGFVCHEVDVGFKNVSSAIKKYDALIGGESSGGLTMRGYIYGKDSTFALALVIEMLIAMKKPLSKVIEEVRNFADFHHVIIEDSISYKDDKKVCSYLENETIDFPDEVLKVERINRNIKYIFADDSWVLLRRSGTEPVLRIFVEMRTKEKAEQYVKRLNEYVEHIDNMVHE